jgi:diguanylate cyclase (GGDEF)-like protein
MALGLGKSVSETTAQLLARLGLKPRDLSPAAVAAVSALAAERDELVERLEVAEALADRDTLTPTFNRRAFMRELHRTMSEVERYRTPAAVLFVDLDGFKAVNDSHGHAAGDAVLRQVGRLLADSVRESDVVGRLGGDEFGLILNRATPDEAAAKAELLSAALNHTAIIHAGIAHHVRVSIGVHAIASVEDPEAALARADEAMYAEKYARRAEAQRFASF